MHIRIYRIQFENIYGIIYNHIRIWLNIRTIYDIRIPLPERIPQKIIKCLEIF